MADLFENLRPASFRGVPFQVDGTEMETGRRNQTHEYPQRDKPYVQDLGRATRQIKFDAFVIGADYLQQHNNLLAALEDFGSGQLVHPWYGALKANATSCSVSLNRELGYARFSLSFVESGELAFPTAANATANLSRAAADGLEAASNDFFAQVFQTAGFISDVADKATRVYGTVLDFMANPVFALASLTGWNNLPGNLSSLMALFGVPSQLADTFSGLLDLRTKAVDSGITGKHPAALPVVRGLVRMATDTALAQPATITVTTSAAQQVAANHGAIVAQTRQMLLTQAVWLSSYLAAEIYDDTLALKTELTAALDAETLLTTNDDLYQALMAARTAIWQDLTERSRGSARLLTVTYPDVLPALVIAYDHHEDAARDLEIVARNKIRNPGFVPVLPIRVLSQ